MENKNRKIIISILILLMMLSAVCAGRKSVPVDRVILDCDMGSMNDDALALSMLLQGEKHGGFEVIGITLEGGNTFVDAAFETDGMLQSSGWDNTDQFLESINRTDVPVYKGTDFPLGFTEESIPELTAYYENADYLPFNDGYGAIHAFESTVSGSLCSSDAAAGFMMDSVRKYPGSVVIIAIGPTMNIARAVERDPAFAGNVKAVYYMGGALGDRYEAETIKGEKVFAVAGANVTPYAEYNALYDPDALLTCLTAGFPKQYITPAELNVEYDSCVTERLKAAGESIVAARWLEQYECSIPGYPYWDPVTAFAYLRPECIADADERYITVNTDRSSDRFGETVAIGAEEYKALPGNEKSKYGMITVINGVESFWDETVALLGESD